MSAIYLIIILLVLGGAVAAAFWFVRRGRQNRWLDEALTSPLIASWTYTPSQWAKAVADEFSWGRPDESAQIYFYLSLVYIQAESGKQFFPLERDDRVVTFAGYAAIEGSPLKLRVRWKVVSDDQEGNRQTKYYKEDYRIPVPLQEKAEALKVVEFFTTRLENNLTAYTAVVPDDEPISLFGKDSF